MKTTNQKNYYTPQFSELTSVSVRRLAWALEMNMVKTMDFIVQILPHFLEYKAICKQCRDNSKCNCCIFKSPKMTEDFILKLEKLYNSELNNENTAPEENT